MSFYGAQGVDGLRIFLKKKFGSLVAGWRAMDTGKSGRISFYHFCNACRKIGYHGNMKKLWEALDVNKSGGISLMELDPETGEYVGTFKLALMKKYGDMLTAWKQGVDVNGSGKIEEKEIHAAIQNLGLDLDAKKLYGMLISGPKGAGLTLAQFDPDSWTRWTSGDHKGLALKANREFLDDLPALESGAESMPEDVLKHAAKGGVQKKREQHIQEQKVAHQEAQDAIQKMKAGLYTVEGFRKALIARCGSLYAGWNNALDLDGNGRQTFGEFCLAMSRLGWHGDVQGLWKQLDIKGKGEILYSDLDPETSQGVLELRQKLTDEYGNMLTAWLKCIDAKGVGRVNKAEFAKGCSKVGFSGDAEKLFRAMQPFPWQKFLTLQDFDVKAYKALLRGDFRMLSEAENPNKGKNPLELDFHQRQEAGHFYQIRKSWEAAKRAEFAKGCREQVFDFVIDTPEEFEDLCVRRYGTMIGAWRNCMDFDANGKITFNEFCKALRMLGYAGNFKTLWSNYDKEGKGHIALRDLDMEADDMVNNFLNLLSDKYGTLDNAWKFGFGKDPHDSITVQELTEACGVLGYEHDPAKLFKFLQRVPGWQVLTIWDIDPLCTRKRQRGDAAIFPDEKGKPRTPHGDSLEASAERSAMMSTSMTSMKSTQSHSGDPKQGTPLPQLLRTSLARTHGTTVSAWRIAIDPQMTNKVQFGKLVVALETCMFMGNVKKLWEELSLGQPSIAFRDIDEEAAGILDGFRELLLDKAGSLLGAWRECLDVDGMGRVDEEEFIRACKSLDVSSIAKPKKIFRLLLARHGQRSLVCQDLRALLIGLPASERAVVWSGDAPAESSLSTPPMSPKLSSSPRDHANKVVKEHHQQDLIVGTIEGFKKKLVEKFGSLFSAWRKLLDIDQNGLCTQFNFADACRALGIKAVPRLWSDLDVCRTGHITLGDIDPEVAEAFGTFEGLLLDQFGSTKEGWKKVFRKRGEPWCDMTEFVARCKSIEYPGDAEQLFRLLRPEPGRPFLTYEDLWQNVDMNNNRAPDDPSVCKAASPKARTPGNASVGPTSPAASGAPRPAR